jgi:HEAT repeat protein
MNTSSASDLDTLADFVTNMIIQHDYPGFEPRSFRIGLTEQLLKSSARLYADALGHPSVYVRLTALRWFQEKPGAIKPYLKAILGLLTYSDEWVRMEATITLERYQHPAVSIALAVSEQLEDQYPLVRREAAKALGKMLAKIKENTNSKNAAKNAERDLELAPIVESLKNALRDDEDAQVRQKAEKALRKSGAYAG